MSRTPLAQIAHRLRTADPSLAVASDRQLLDRSRNRADESAFTELVRRHERAVLAACRQVLHETADVEDAFQATFLVLVQQANRMRCGESLGGWLFTVAHRVAVRARRSRTRATRRESAARKSDGAARNGADLSWQEAVAALHEELDALPDRFRLPLILCYLDGLSRDEAAKKLGWKPGSVKAGLERGREKLRAALERRGITLGAGLLTALAGLNSVASASPTLIAATLHAAHGGASSTVLELARPTMSAFTAKAKLLLVPVIAVALCAGLLGAGTSAPPLTTEQLTTPDPRPAEQLDSRSSKEISGRVTGPDGKPVAGAKVFTVKKVKPGGGGDRVEVATSSADGTFRFARPTKDDVFVPMVLVYKDGLGVAWHDLDEVGAPKVLELKLVADHTITGRVIDTEGKPVVGVRVFADRITAPKEETVDALLEALKSDKFRTGSMFGGNGTRSNWAGGVGSVTTGADGKFSLSGCGAERLVQLAISGDGLAHKSAIVVNRAKFDPTEINALEEATRKDTPGRPAQIFNGPDVRVVVERAKTVEGIIIDAATKKPIAGVWVSDLIAPVKTDAEGRFKLIQFKKAKQYTLYVGAPVDSAYLMQTVRVEDTEGYTPAKCTIELRTGVVVTGKITDKVTGKPVSAGVTVFPIGGNKHFAEYYPRGQFVERTAHLTDKDGRFRVVTVPGQLLVSVQGHETVPVGDARLMPYRGAGPDPAHPEVFDTKRQPGYAFLSLADSSLHSISNLNHGVRVIDVPADSKSFNIDFALDRGATGHIQIEGPDGKPVKGATVVGLAHENFPATLTEASATVYALDPKSAPRRVIAWDAEKKIGGTVTVRGDELEPVIVKLAPLGDIRGKFVTADGKPVGGAVVLIEPAEHMDALAAFLSMQFGSGNRTRTKTAADGTFHLAGVLPGVEYHLRMRMGKTTFPASGDTKKLSAKPESGKTTDLGTIDVGMLRDE